MRKNLVTGGAGFIGGHLVEALVAAGQQVCVLDDLSTGNRTNLKAVQGQVDFIEGSITDQATVEKAIEGCEVVYHLGALPSVKLSVENPLLCHEICATGTLRVLEAARKAGVRRLVFAASSSAYGNAPEGARLESDPLNPLSPYAAAKLASEHYCQCFTEVYGLETVRLRFFNVFGPRQDPKSPYSGVIAIFSNLMTQGKTPRIDGDGLQSRDFVYIANVVQALQKAADAPAAVGQVYNIGMGSSTNIVQLVAHLNDILKTQIQPIHGPPRSGDVRHSLADISAARKDLGYEPTVRFAEGLRKTIQYNQANNE